MAVKKSRSIPLYWFSVFVLLLPSVCQSQDAKNVVYAELAGPGILYSVNYERVMTPNFTTRVGASVWPYSFGGQLTTVVIPIMANYLLGRGDSKFEIGLGADVCLSDVMEPLTSHGSNRGFLIVGSLGYRNQPSNGGVHYRFVASPILSPATGNILPTIGCSIGMCF